jgi:hypothetical protein
MSHFTFHMFCRQTFKFYDENFGRVEGSCPRYFCFTGHRLDDSRERCQRSVSRCCQLHANRQLRTEEACLPILGLFNNHDSFSINYQVVLLRFQMNYAKSQPDMAIMAVNTFVKDCEDPNPLIR